MCDEWKVCKAGYAIVQFIEHFSEPAGPCTCLPMIQLSRRIFCHLFDWVAFLCRGIERLI